MRASLPAACSDFLVPSSTKQLNDSVRHQLYTNCLIQPPKKRKKSEVSMAGKHHVYMYYTCIKIRKAAAFFHGKLWPTNHGVFGRISGSSVVHQPRFIAAFFCWIINPKKMAGTSAKNNHRKNMIISGNVTVCY